MAGHNIQVSCILHFNGLILLIKESQNGVVHWDIPAGGLEKRELIQEGLRREILEETGIRVFGDPVLYQTFQYLHMDSNTSFHFLYKYQLNESELKIINNRDTGIEDVKFFNKHEVSQLILNRKYEHNLAKARLELFLYPDRTSNKEIMLIKA